MLFVAVLSPSQLDIYSILKGWTSKLASCTRENIPTTMGIFKWCQMKLCFTMYYKITTWFYLHSYKWYKLVKLDDSVGNTLYLGCYYKNFSHFIYWKNRNIVFFSLFTFLFYVAYTNAFIKFSLIIWFKLQGYSNIGWSKFIW